VLRSTAMLFKELKLKFSLIKNVGLKGEKRESPA
jgi:hypothetical protein